MSSCNSLPIRVRSCSCASISFRLMPKSASSACLRSVMSELPRKIREFRRLPARRRDSAKVRIFPSMASGAVLAIPTVFLGSHDVLRQGHGTAHLRPTVRGGQGMTSKCERPSISELMTE